MRSESFPCIKCGKVLLRDIDDYEAQPSHGVMCSTGGNDGSTVFDPMNGERIYFNICDECFTSLGATGALMVTQVAIPITTYTHIHEDLWGPSQVGWRETDRPFVPWYPAMAHEYQPENMEIEEIIERFEDPKFKWNLTLEGYQYIQKELDDRDKELEGK